MTQEKPRRRQFEKWARGPKLPLKRVGSLYAEYMTQLAWAAWSDAVSKSAEIADSIASHEIFGEEIRKLMD